MRPGLAKIIENVSILRYFEKTETDHHIAENACCIDYADPWSSKRVRWLSKGHSTKWRTTYYGCENMVEFDTGVAGASLPIMRIHGRVAQDSSIQQLQATIHNTGWMDHRQVSHGSFKAILILDPVAFKMAYSYSASCHRCLQWHVWSYGLRYASFGQAEDTMVGRLILCQKGWTTEAVQILSWSHFSDRFASHFGIYRWSFLEVAII